MSYYRRRSQRETRMPLAKQIGTNPDRDYLRIRVRNPAVTGRWDEYIDCTESTKPVEQDFVISNPSQSTLKKIAKRAGISTEEVRQILVDGYAQINTEDSIRGWCFEAEKDSPRRTVWSMRGWHHCGCKRCRSTGTVSSDKITVRDENANGCRTCNGTGLQSRWQNMNTFPVSRWAFPASWSNAECRDWLQTKLDRAEAVRIGKEKAKEARRLEKIANALATNDRMMIVETGCTLEEIKNACPNNSFIRDVCDKGMNGVVLSLKQLEALGNSYERQIGRNEANEEYKKTATEVPSGRQEIVGEVQIGRAHV